VTLEDYNQRINAVIEDLKGGAHAKIMAEMALDAIALIKQRVIQTGRNPEGELYRDYTKRYKAYKKKAGKYRGFVDFSFSTRMWANLKLVSTEDQLRKGIAKVSCTTTVEQEKLNKNTEQRGEILALSDYERDLLLSVYDEKILNIWRKNGL